MKRGATRQFSVKTGRRRRLIFNVLGTQTHIDVHERVELFDLASGQRLPTTEWLLPGGKLKIPIGTTTRYFEYRDDTRERVRDYTGFVRAETR